MTAEEIKKLIEFVDQHRITELKVVNGKDKLLIKNKKSYNETSDLNDEDRLTMNSEENRHLDFQKKVITAPLVGIFYSAPEEGGKSFVEVGDHVSIGQTLGIIEAMKLMNEINSDQEGIVKEILVENGQMVEYNQPLFVIE